MSACGALIGGNELLESMSLHAVSKAEALLTPGRAASVEPDVRQRASRRRDGRSRLCASRRAKATSGELSFFTGVG